MRESKRQRPEIKELDFTALRIGRHRVPAVHRSSKLDFANSISYYGWSARGSNYYLTYKEFTNCLAIIGVSAATVTIGFGELFLSIWK